MGSSLNASKDIGVGVTDLALACGSEPVAGAVCTAVVGSARTGRVLDAGSAHKDRSSDAWSVGDTRQSLSEMMTASCTLIISAEQHERVLATRHRVTSQHVSSCRWRRMNFLQTLVLQVLHHVRRLSIGSVT